MSEVYIDAGALSAASQSVSGLAARLTQQCEELNQSLQSLSAAWQGEDAEACIALLKQSISTLQQQSQYFPAFAQALAASASLWSSFEKQGQADPFNA